MSHSHDECETCKGAGAVWARAWALPMGFKIFAGRSIRHSDDHQHVEITCPSCDGSGKTLPQKRGQR